MKHAIKFKHLCMVLIMCFLYTTAFAEYNHELGITGGVSFYLGDANNKTPFWKPRIAVGGMYRYNIDTRWAVKVCAIYAQVEGDTRDFEYIMPGGVHASFKRSYVDASLSVEFNFLDIGESKYAIGNYKATPYIMLGVGLTAYSDLFNAKNMYHVNIPVGIGGKWKINKRFTLGLEWSIHKMFIDNFDVTSSSNIILDNPYQSSKNGFFDTDWYSICNLYLTVNLFDTKRFCR